MSLRITVHTAYIYIHSFKNCFVTVSGLNLVPLICAADLLQFRFDRTFLSLTALYSKGVFFFFFFFYTARKAALLEHLKVVNLLVLASR